MNAGFNLVMDGRNTTTTTRKEFREHPSSTITYYNIQLRIYNNHNTWEINLQAVAA
jgi:hypothetical protein